MNGSALSLLWFVAIVAMIPAVLWLLKRSPMGASLGAAGAGPVRPVASVAVGPQQRIVTVEVVEAGERRWLVLGVTAQQITHLYSLTAPPAEAAPAAPVPPTPFAALLSNWRNKRPEDRDVQ
jgi:flagellar protein FliO/FliZ